MHLQTKVTLRGLLTLCLSLGLGLGTFAQGQSASEQLQRNVGFTSEKGINISTSDIQILETLLSQDIFLQKLEGQKTSIVPVMDYGNFELEVPGFTIAGMPADFMDKQAIIDSEQACFFIVESFFREEDAGTARVVFQYDFDGSYDYFIDRSFRFTRAIDGWDIQDITR